MTRLHFESKVSFPAAVPKRLVLGHKALVACIVASMILPLLLYLPFLTEPFEKDEGFYAAVAQLILHGDLPYRDSFDNKPPVVFGWYAISFLLFGEHVWAPRLLVSMLLSVTTGLIYIQGRLLFSRREALIAAFAFATSIGVIRFHTNANTEYFMLLPMVAGLLTFTLGMRGGGRWWFFLSGIMHGIAIMTKETSVFNFGFLMLWAIFPMCRNRALDFKVLTSLSVMAAGCALAVFAIILPFVLLGAGNEFFDTAIVYTLQYVGDRSAAQRITDMILTAVFPLAVACPWLILVFFATFRLSGDRWHWLVFGWLLASEASILFVGRFYAHYYAILLPGMGLVAPLGVRYLKSQWEKSRILPVLVMVSTIGLAIWFNGPAYVQDSPADRHLAKFPGDPQAEFEVQSPDLAAYIADNTLPGDKIYNLGFQAETYFYADRRSPTKYMFDRPFAVDNSLLKDALRDLNADKPVLIIDSARYEPSGDMYYDREAVLEFIKANYDYVGKVYYADVYRLKEEVASGILRGH